MTPYDVVDFWFGAPGSPTHGKRRIEWFKKSAEFDDAIRSRFLGTCEQAASGALADWADSPLTLLALIVVLDQFPRNMFRESPRAFATDTLALAGAGKMINLCWDQRLTPIERGFAYLPFEHSENIADQRRSLQLFDVLRAYPLTSGLHEWAHKHYVIIERFGRFPHRNAILGRASMPEEVEFLKQPGSDF